MSNGKHLTLLERTTIEELLGENISISRIATKIGVAKSTVSREIALHAKEVRAKKCDCVHFINCRMTGLCEHCPYQRKKCRECPMAAKRCPKYEYRDCPEKSHAHTCNHCVKKGHCSKMKLFYHAGEAQEAYRTLLTEARNGFSLSEEELSALSGSLAGPIKNGQSIYAAMQACKEDIIVSESTVRRLIYAARLKGVQTIDLPKAVRFHKRNYDYRHKAKAIAAKKGRMIEDYNAFIREHGPLPVVEMDTVVSKKGTTAALLTLLFVDSSLQVAHLMANNTPGNVVDYFNDIELCLGKEKFMELFPVIITDNGTEFDDFEGIEDSLFGGKRTRVFFCHPYCSSEKPHCENNHGLIRRILKKGIDFTEITQTEVNVMMNHINSYVRKKFSGIPPVEIALMGMEVYEIKYFGLYAVDARDVVIHPSLLESFYKRTGQAYDTLGKLSGLTDS